MEECDLTQENLSSRVGKKRSTIANYLRLLKLPAVIQKALREKQISMGHARAIINIEDEDTRIMIYDQILKYGFSVRRVEEIVSDLNNEDRALAKMTGKKKLPKKYQSIKSNLDKLFTTRVGFSMNDNGKGKIVIPFSSENELDRIVKIIENQE
jgi:ParB family chromosome partitioning protein